MSLRQYEIFLKIVESGSVSKAAQLLNSSQSGVTQQLRALETELGLTLLVRNKGGVRLTQAGEALFYRIREVVEADRKVQRMADELHRNGGNTLRIATFKSIAVNWLPYIMKEFQAAHPEAQFKLLDGCYTEVEGFVRSGEADFGFISLPTQLDCECIPICNDRLLAVLPCTHRMAAEPGVPVEQFGREPVVSLIDSTNQDANRVLNAAGVVPDVRFQTADDYAMLSMVESGLGICICHELVLRNDHHQVSVRPLIPPAYRTIGIAIPNLGEAKPLVKRFVEFTKEWAAHAR